MNLENLPHEVQDTNASYTLSSIMGTDPIYAILNEKCKDMTNTELFDMMIKSYRQIFISIFNENNLLLLNKIINDNKLLESFAKAISSSILTDIEIQYTTQLTYDYIKMKNISKNKEVQGILTDVCRKLHQMQIATLIAFIPEAIALNMCIARYSSSTDKKNIQRLNTVILSTPNMTTQQVVNIYGILFKRMSPLFIWTMFDIRNIERNNYQEEVNSMISNAILYLLDNMEMNNINKVLSKYSEELKVTDIIPRFSLHSISFDEFPRISQMVSQFKQEGKYLF